MKQRQIAHLINQRKRYLIRLSLYTLVHMQLSFLLGGPWTFREERYSERGKRQVVALPALASRIVAHEVPWRPQAVIYLFFFAAAGQKCSGQDTGGWCMAPTRTGCIYPHQINIMVKQLI